jgi:hypothetical protein
VVVPKPARKLWQWAALMFASAVLGGILLSLWPHRRPFGEEQLTSNSAENPVTASVISPDAKYVAYANSAGLHLHVVASAETHAIPVIALRHIDRIVWYSDSTRLLISGSDDSGLGVWAVSISVGQKQPSSGTHRRQPYPAMPGP